MTKVNVITPKDKLYNKNYTILLIATRPALLQEIQDDILPKIDRDLNIYFYDSKNDDLEWVLSVFKMSDMVLFDVDNSSSQIRTLASYFISEEKTYWLTNEQSPVYNYISRNRIYNAQFMLKIGGKIG